MTADRDRSIERLLRQVRPEEPALPADDCPDAETLAALADDTLPAALRREVEAAHCRLHHCQALAAAIARAGAPVGAPADAAGEMPAWRRRALNWLVPAAAAATAVALWVLVPGQNTPPPTGADIGTPDWRGAVSGSTSSFVRGRHQRTAADSSRCARGSNRRSAMQPWKRDAQRPRPISGRATRSGGTRRTLTQSRVSGSRRPSAFA